MTPFGSVYLFREDVWAYTALPEPVKLIRGETYSVVVYVPAGPMWRWTKGREWQTRGDLLYVRIGHFVGRS